MFTRIYYALLHWLKCVNDHSLHSPFLFNTYKKLIRTKYKDPESVREYLSKLKSDNTSIAIKDYGAGSTSFKSNIRKIKNIAKTSTSSHAVRKIIYNYFSQHQPKCNLELGTNLGITTLLMSEVSAEYGGQIYSFEGSSSLSEISLEAFAKYGKDNIIVIEGNLDNTLTPFLKGLNKKIDFIYMDANHTYEATINYLNILYPYLSDTSSVLIGDIYWSKGMKKAWKEISSSNKFQTKLDFFHSGLLIKGPEIPIEHEILMSRPL